MKMKTLSPVVNETLEIFQSDGRTSVEISIGRERGVVGVLMAPTYPVFMRNICEAWTRSVGRTDDVLRRYIDSPLLRLVRVDMTAIEWKAVGVYADPFSDAVIERWKAIPAPLAAEAIRVTVDGKSETAHYFDVRGCVPQMLARTRDALSNQLEFSKSSAELLVTLWDKVDRQGWAQTMAASADSHRLKVTFAMMSDRSTLQLVDAIGDPGDADRVRKMLGIIKGSLGYLGIWINASGKMGWRAYAEVSRCKDIHSMVAKVLEIA